MIEVNNLTPLSGVNKKFLKGVAKIVLKGENKKEARLSIALVGEGRIKELNKKYRGKNRATDVLAFGQNQKFLVFPKSELELEEVIICLRVVKKNAKKYNIAFKKELARVLIHGILHLLGYEHEKDEREAKKMEKKQKYYLSQII